MRRMLTRAFSLMYCTNKTHETCAAEELCHEYGSMSLGIRAFDPLQAMTEYAGVAAAFAQHTTPIATHLLPCDPVLCLHCPSSLLLLPLSSNKVNLKYTNFILESVILDAATPHGNQSLP